MKKLNVYYPENIKVVKENIKELEKVDFYPILCTSLIFKRNEHEQKLLEEIKSYKRIKSGAPMMKEYLDSIHDEDKLFEFKNEILSSYDYLGLDNVDVVADDYIKANNHFLNVLDEDYWCRLIKTIVKKYFYDYEPSDFRFGDDDYSFKSITNRTFSAYNIAENHNILRESINDIIYDYVCDFFREYRGGFEKIEYGKEYRFDVLDLNFPNRQLLERYSKNINFTYIRRGLSLLYFTSNSKDKDLDAAYDEIISAMEDLVNLCHANKRLSIEFCGCKINIFKNKFSNVTFSDEIVDFINSLEEK